MNSYVVSDTPSIPETSVTIQEPYEPLETPAEPTTPVPILGILGGIICGIVLVKRK